MTEGQVQAEAELALQAAEEQLAAAQEAVHLATLGHVAARATHAEAVAAVLAKTAKKGQHIFLEAPDGSHRLVEAPDGYNADRPDRVIHVGGRGYIHVADGVNGIWVYRVV